MGWMSGCEKVEYTRRHEFHTCMHTNMCTNITCTCILAPLAEPRSRPISDPPPLAPPSACASLPSDKINIGEKRNLRRLGQAIHFVLITKY